MRTKRERKRANKREGKAEGTLACVAGGFV